MVGMCERSSVGNTHGDDAGEGVEVPSAGLVVQVLLLAGGDHHRVLVEVEDGRVHELVSEGAY